MPRFAVGFYNFYGNTLIVQIHSAPTWREAALKHEYSCWSTLEEVPLELEDARAYAFDCDFGFDCVEIPE